MGNCLKNSNKVVAQTEQENPQKEMKDDDNILSSATRSRNIAPELRSLDGKKKRVSFKLEEENVLEKGDREKKGNEANSEAESSEARSKMEEVKNVGGERKGRVVRVRVVVTKKELKKILSGEDFGYSNLEELIAAFKLRGRKVSQVRTSETSAAINGSWRPALENIPEEG